MEIERVIDFCKALGDRRRLEIVQVLVQGERCGCHILEDFEISQPTLSHHMKILVEAGLVEDRKEGKWHHYSINGQALEDMKGFLDSIKPDPFQEGKVCK
ncbi:MAG: metalloregulator ArsR/SmtB family transcription factor [Tissierellia bacterium]|nr:metalloregulator ArsR/SmtB family transcription factor [Tissierellia bacterium]